MFWIVEFLIVMCMLVPPLAYALITAICEVFLVIGVILEFIFRI
jgi:hypothetical protein